MDFYTLFPALEPFVQNLTGMWPASMIRQSPWMFAVIEATHLLSLAALGGSVLLLNLRLIGVGLTSETPASLERTLRPFLWGSLAAIALSGVCMAMVIAEKLFTSGAYFVKMITLVAALIFSFGVTTPLARSDGAVSLTAKIAGGIALATWLFAVFIFGKSSGMNPGTFHIVSAGFLIAMIFGSRMTRIVLGGVVAAAVIILGIVTYVVYNPLDNYELVMAIDIWSVRIAALLVAAALAWEIIKPSPDAAPSPALARLAGMFGILLWVTVAAAGRWIGLG